MSRFDSYIATIVKQIVSTPSISGEETLLADWLQAHLVDEHGFTVRRVGNNLIASDGSERPFDLMLCSHIDTVPPCNNWTTDPFNPSIVDDRIYGLESNDAGASVAAMIVAASKYLGSENINIGLVLAAEEESGVNGFMSFEKSLCYNSAIFGEPTNLHAGSRMRGQVYVEFGATGNSCHASRPWEGVNAIRGLVSLMKEIESIELPGNGTFSPTLEPTMLSAGVAPNILPSIAAATYDVRTTEKYNLSWFENEFTKRGIGFRYPEPSRDPKKLDENSLLAAAVAACNLESYDFGGTCDMAFSTAPSIVLGPGKSDRSHAPDEFIRIDELQQAVRVYDAVISKLSVTRPG